MQIYPRDLLANIKTGLNRQAFILMPFHKELESTYVTIMDACKEIAIPCLRADSLFDQKPILTHVVECIGISQILIADLTGKNPNVFYEVGIAHATRSLESIILICENLSDVPFDLRHLPILLYSPEEQLKFKIALRQRIEAALAISDGLNVIRNIMHRGDFSAQQVTNFIDFLSKNLAGQIHLISQFIQDKSDDESSFEPSYWAVIRSIENAGDIERKQLQFLAVSLLSSNFAIRKKHTFVRDQLRPVLTSRYKSQSLTEPAVIAQLCFSAIQTDFLKNECIEWLISYLKNDKVGTVNVLRSQIENWLIEDSDPDVENALITCLTSPIAQMREVASDILGMRENKKILQRVKSALEIESDPYAARSMITALSRAGDPGYGKIIEKWVLKNFHLWDSGPKSPSLPKTAANALANLGYDRSDIDTFLHSCSNIIGQ